jgi:hypothetical protein
MHPGEQLIQLHFDAARCSFLAHGRKIARDLAVEQSYLAQFRTAQIAQTMVIYRTHQRTQAFPMNFALFEPAVGYHNGIDSAGTLAPFLNIFAEHVRAQCMAGQWNYRISLASKHRNW